ncbi:Hypothetical protein DHA2_150532, partial [Giardia duodenalis]
VSGTASCCGRHPAGGPGHHSPVRAGSVRLCQPSTPTPISCRGIHMGHVWVHLDQRAMILISISLACERLIPPPASDAHLHSLPPWRRRHNPPRQRWTTSDFRILGLS